MSKWGLFIYRLCLLSLVAVTFGVVTGGNDLIGAGVYLLGMGGVLVDFYE